MLERVRANRAKRKAAQAAKPAAATEPPAAPAAPAEAPKRRAKKKGFTKMDNDLIAALKGLTASEYAVMVALTRNTTGWHREEVAMSQNDLVEATGKSKSSVKRALRSLRKAGLIGRTRATVNHQKSYAYRVLKEGVERRLGGVKKNPGVGSKRTRPNARNAVSDEVHECLKKDKERDDAKAHAPTSVPAKKEGVEDAEDDSAVESDSVAGGVNIIALTSPSSAALDAVRADIRARKYDGVRGYRDDGVGLMNLQPWLERRLEANDAAALLGFEVNAPATPALQRAA